MEKEKMKFNASDNDHSNQATGNSDEKNMVVLLHALSFITGFLGPLIIWLMKREDSTLIDQQGKEVLNFHISFYIYTFVSALSMILFIGFIIFPIVMLIYLVLMIVGLVKALNGGQYNYPLTIQFLK